MAFDCTCQQSGERTQNGHTERRPLGISNLSELYSMLYQDSTVCTFVIFRLEVAGTRRHWGPGSWKMCYHNCCLPPAPHQPMCLAEILCEIKKEKPGEEEVRDSTSVDSKSNAMTPRVTVPTKEGEECQVEPRFPTVITAH